MCWFGAEVKGGAVGKVEFEPRAAHPFFTSCFLVLSILYCLLLSTVQEVRRMLVTRAEEVGNTLLNDLICHWQLKGTEAKVAIERVFHVG